MRKSLLAQAYVFLRAPHFGPTVIVTTITFVLALSQFSLIDASELL